MDNNNQQNVTFRRIRRSISFHEMSNTTIFDSTMLSLPDTSINTHKSCCEDLRNKVETLTTNLVAATNEIDNLHGEISNLKNELAKYLKVLEVYKKIDCSDLSKTLSNRKQKRLSMYDKNRATLITSSPTQHVAVSPLSDKCDLDAPVNESPAKDILTEVSTVSAAILTPGPVNNMSSSSSTLPQGSKSTLKTTTQETLPVQRKKVIVLGDDQGRYIRYTLQALLGNDFQVLCFWKPGAKTTDVLINSYNFDSLTKKDYVIVLSGTNDTNPLDLQIDLGVWFRSIKHANIIVSEVPYNNHLNERSLNSSLSHVCNKYNGLFVNMGYSQSVPRRQRHLTVNICRYLLKEILHIEFKTKFLTYTQQNRTLTKPESDQSTQTCNIPDDVVITACDKSTQTGDFPDENIINYDLSLCGDKELRAGSSNCFRV